MQPNEEDTAVSIPVPKKDPKKTEERDTDNTPQRQTSQEPGVAPEGELSEEDQALKEGLELAVTRLQESNVELYRPSLEHLAREIRTSTSSMTAVPKPLKFLRPHYDTLKEVYQKFAAGDDKKMLADILSVLAITMATPGARESLNFKLAGTSSDLAAWGHEYVRSLAGEISEEYNDRFVNLTEEDEDEPEMGDLMTLVNDIVPYHMTHNAEAEAVDLLMEVQQLPKLREDGIVDENNFERVCLYLIRSADFMADPDDLQELLESAYYIYRKHGRPTDALRVAIRMDDLEKIGELMTENAENVPMTKQMALILGRQRVNYEAADDDVNSIIANTHLSEHFRLVARELDVMEPKLPEDIYKSHLAETGARLRRGGDNNVAVDSARANLASTYVNAFVNAGFGRDKLITEDEEWVFKNKEHGMMAATASLGMVLMWDVDEGLNHLDKYFHHADDFIKAGACLGIGVVSSGVRHESDPALALLSEHLESTSSTVQCAAIVGLGIAYAGSQREDIMELLLPLISAVDMGKMTEASLAALALGHIFVGTCHGDIASTILQRMVESSDAELDQSIARLMCLGLGLLFLGKTEKAEPMQEALMSMVEHRIGQYAQITLETCAYAGTGNVLKIQRMLHICAEHLTEKADHQAVAVLGIALTALGEDIGSEMSYRTFDHLLHYGELPIKRVVPLAVALLNVSNPDYAVIDQMSRLSHDGDAEVAQGAILGLGIVSAGTNNSRVAGLLRQLSEFYAKEPNHLFAVRIAQGLNSMAKGLVTLNPIHSDRFLMNRTALAGLLTLMHASLDLKNILLDKYHFLLYFLSSAMNPRYLLTVDNDMNFVPVSVRVGQAVETVGQAGRPKTITGFQTHTTPVLLGIKDRAELATSDHISLASVLEGVAIVDKNPDAEQVEDK